MSSLRERLGSTARLAEVDAAVAFAILAKVWQIIGGIVTMVAVVRYLTPAAQGFFYTFNSLLGLQSFFELAFYLVIINAASHEWAHLRLEPDGSIGGERDALSRLVSLGRVSAKWYAVASLLFLVGVGSAGLLFFGTSADAGVAWRGPWIALVFCSAIVLFALPFQSLLEGCNQVAVLQRYRLQQVILSALALWATLFFGFGLWAAAAAAFATIVNSLVLILHRYRRFFSAFLKPPQGARLDWRADVWPMQWRLALSGVVSFLAVSLFNPVMFRYHGAAAAGRMGMTLAMTAGVQAIALAWISTRVPRFGQYVSRRDWRSLDALWWRSTIISTAVAATGAIAAFLLVYVLNDLKLPVAQRLLPPVPTAILLAGAVIMHISQCQSAYLRAHRQEPIVWMSVTCSVLTGLGVWWFGARMGPIGAAWSYLTVAGITIVWETAIWRRCRALWHTP
ncbi:MAG: hypothetical protein ACJ74H_02450 [Thermoanaerobaculia bacterium]